ncbi:CRISPR-associated endonuclease Cas1 [Xenococcus sp. PCC 7305]|uniref:CRISPR-associated endonuclease Cas1 n=1 Tax=Xenococcus sp. PCC 7305 TaxID=102125 RepID=UPI000A0755B4|nr:CRISPR-associated endonuclease Cas1 [Xenococcus sp. PCC 7305]
MATIYVLEYGSYLKVQHQKFQVLQQKKLLFQVPVREVTNIILFGYCHLSHGAVQTALFRKIPIIYYSSQGYYLGCLESKTQSKVTYLTEQVRRAENENFVRQQAEIIVRAKLRNARILLMRINRRRPNEVTNKTITELKKIIKCLDVHPPLASLRGYEGKGARIYFQGLSKLFKGEFSFNQRTLRPPKDPINSLLGFGYTLLCQELISTIQLAGLHTDYGNLHTPRNHHPALVLDLMEEFRAQIVDSLIVYFVNKKIFSQEDFTLPDEKGAVYLKQESLKKFLKYWSEKLSTELTHPPTQRKVTLRTCLKLQVKEYISCLMGKSENYQPMLWQK